MRVADDDDTLGTFTHATSSPVLLTYFSISWLSFVVPSDEVKRMSLPVDRALLCRSVSVRLTRTGKLACGAPVAPTFVWSIESVFRYAQFVSYQLTALTVVEGLVSAVMPVFVISLAVTVLVPAVFSVTLKVM